jgi:serine/threonine protein kinase
MKNRRVDDESEIEKKYSFGEVLGQGAFGVVREVTNRQTHQKLAMKIVHKDKVGVAIMPLISITAPIQVYVCVFSNFPQNLMYAHFMHLRV